MTKFKYDQGIITGKLHHSVIFTFPVRTKNYSSFSCSLEKLICADGFDLIICKRGLSLDSAIGGSDVAVLNIPNYDFLIPAKQASSDGFSFSPSL